jgi:hypothetical protein
LELHVKTVYKAFHSTDTKEEQTEELTSLHHFDSAIVQNLKILTIKLKPTVFHGERHTIIGEQNQ